MNQGGGGDWGRTDEIRNSKLGRTAVALRRAPLSPFSKTLRDGQDHHRGRISTRGRPRTRNRDPENPAVAGRRNCGPLARVALAVGRESAASARVGRDGAKRFCGSEFLGFLQSLFLRHFKPVHSRVVPERPSRRIEYDGSVLLKPDAAVAHQSLRGRELLGLLQLLLRHLRVLLASVLPCWAAPLQDGPCNDPAEDDYLRPPRSVLTPVSFLDFFNDFFAMCVSSWNPSCPLGLSWQRARHWPNAQAGSSHSPGGK